MTKTIPMGAIKIQEGLYLLETPFTVSGVQYIRRELYSAEGYSFWERRQAENYVDGDTKGELLPLNERILSTYASLSAYYTTIDSINTDFISEKTEV